MIRLFYLRFPISKKLIYIPKDLKIDLAEMQKALL